MEDHVLTERDIIRNLYYSRAAAHRTLMLMNSRDELIWKGRNDG